MITFTEYKVWNYVNDPIVTEFSDYQIHISEPLPKWSSFPDYVFHEFDFIPENKGFNLKELLVEINVYKIQSFVIMIIGSHNDNIKEIFSYKLCIRAKDAEQAMIVKLAIDVNIVSAKEIFKY